jgi:hypothetical protein
VNAGVLFTSTISLTMRLIWFRSPTGGMECAHQIDGHGTSGLFILCGRRDIPPQAGRSRVCGCSLRYDQMRKQIPGAQKGRRKGTKAATGGASSGSSMLRASSLLYTDIGLRFSRLGFCLL